MGGRFGDYILWVDSRLVVLSRLAMCRFGLAVVISQFWILVILIRMQTSFAVVVSGFGLNVKQRTYSSGACCSDERCHLKFGAVVKLFNVEALVNIMSL